MPEPPSLRQTTDVAIVSGSTGSSPANGSIITAGVRLITYPARGRGEVEMGGPYGPYHIPGKYQAMEFPVEFRSVYADILAATGAVIAFTLTDKIWTPDAVVAAGANPVDYTWAVSGRLRQHQWGARDQDQDAFPGNTYTLRVRTWVEEMAGRAAKICDYDFPNQLFYENGINVFTGAGA